MKKEVTIGRDLSCDIVIPASCDKSSRNHAILIIDNSNVVLQDCSTNGTSVNGTKYHHETIRIKPGDSISFPGGYSLNWETIATYITNPRAATRLDSQTIKMGHQPVVQPRIDEKIPQEELRVKDAFFESDSKKHVIKDHPTESNSIFSFRGRSGRGEYWAICLIAGLINYALSFMIQTNYNSVPLAIGYLVFAVFYVWVIWAAGARRCHDLGHSGWFQLIPFYGIWMAFVSGDSCDNEYGKAKG